MKVIIVEDEFLAQQELTWLINTHSEMEIVGTFDDGLDVLKFLQHNKVDAIFLDINIPSLDGVLLAQNISQFAHKPFIVFITAWKEHAVEAFELEAFDYILKPYQESRIINMLDPVMNIEQTDFISRHFVSLYPRYHRRIDTVSRIANANSYPIPALIDANGHHAFSFAGLNPVDDSILHQRLN